MFYKAITSAPETFVPNYRTDLVFQLQACSAHIMGAGVFSPLRSLLEARWISSEREFNLSFRSSNRMLLRGVEAIIPAALATLPTS